MVCGSERTKARASASCGVNSRSKRRGVSRISIFQLLLINGYSAGVERPNVFLLHACTIHETTDDDSQRFIAMEFLDGMTLKERIGGARKRGEIKRTATLVTL
jgi:hypothetical protein